MAEIRLIDAEAFQKFIEKQDESADYTIFHFEEWLEQQPTIETKPVVHAHWKRKNNEMKCSNCEFIYYSNHDDFNFCPNCGAQMDEKED